MSKQTRNVLIVDDSAEDRATFRRHLEQDDDFTYAFHEAELAADGIARFRAAQPDCVLLDCHLPDMDGLEALAALSQGAAVPGCAVVALIGAGDEALAARALKSGAQDYLVKDKVAPEGVRRAVTNAIEKVSFQRERAVAEADLRESEARYRAFVQASAQIEWLAAPDGGFLREQPSWEAFTGQTFDEYRGDGWMNAIHPDDRERVGKAWRRTVERKDVYEIEERVRRKDGEYRWALARAVPLLDANGAVREWVGTSTDITERKSSEEKLRVSEERLSLAMTGANIGAFDWNIQTGEINWSSEIEEAAAMSAGDFDNSFEGFVKLIHPEDRQLLQQRIEAALKDGDYECEFRMLRGDGSIRWVIGKGRVFFDDDGRPARLVGVDIDITKRKLAEDTLLENQRFTESIIETAPSILYTFDIKSQANTYLTGQAATALGYSFDELKNSKTNFLASYMHPDDTREAERHFRDITRARNGGVFEFEYRMRHKSGEWRWFRSRDMVFKRDAEGRPEEILGVAFDVTERKKAEDELRASEEFNRTVLESSPDCVKILDEAGRLQYMNANGICLLEIDDVAPYKNEFWWNLWEEDAKPVVKESVAKALRGETARFQAFCATAKGTPKWWDIIVSLIPDTDDKPARLISVSRDITKQKLAEEKLRESEQRLRAIYDGTREYIGLLNPAGMLLEANRASLEFGGSRRDEVVGLPFWETVWFKHTPGAPEAVRQAVGRAGAGEFVRYEAPIITPSGEEMAFDISLHPIRDEQGEVVLIVPEGRDITESQRAEELLRESESRLSAILQNTNAVIYLMDEESRFVHINRQFEELFGLKTETARGKSVYELFPKEFADAFVANNRRVLHEGRPLEIEETAPHLDGSVHTYLTVKVPHLDAGGKPIGIVGISTDITERKEAEEALRESEERFRALFDSIDEGFCIVEMIFDEANKPVDYRFVQVNPAMERLTGLTNALGKTARELVPDLEEFWFETYGNVALTGQAARFENKSAPMNRWFDVYASRIGDATSRRVAVVFNNITERKRAELEREEMLEREQVLRREAEQANRLKDEFLATASHELRTPLTAIVGWTRMLRAGNLDEAMTARALETVERNADAQTKLIEDLLDISRIITGKLNLDKQRIELAPVVADAVNTVRPAAEAKGIEIEMAIDSSALAALADAHRIQQVVWNLLSNAVKFTPAEGRVEVALRRVDAQAEISVRDTGEGIEPEFLPYVFDRFRQADGKTTRKHGGLGLGLAIVRQLAEMHGGEVKAHSDGPGRGAVFSLRLPLLGAHTPLAGRATDPSWQETTGVGPLTLECPPSLVGLRVLVVDDDSDTREMLDAVLSECAAEVITVASAAEAAQEIARQRPDVLVSDIGMPEEDGYDLIKKIRAIETTRGDATIPALALTAYAKAEDRVRALEAGYQAHLSKPVEPAEFALVVANLVGRGKTSQDQTGAD